jgi:hypothetical protein
MLALLSLAAMRSGLAVGDAWVTWLALWLAVWLVWVAADFSFSALQTTARPTDGHGGRACADGVDPPAPTGHDDHTRSITSITATTSASTPSPPSGA